jgi:hypothetical protein
MQQNMHGFTPHRAPSDVPKPAADAAPSPEEIVRSSAPPTRLRLLIKASDTVHASICTVLNASTSRPQCDALRQWQMASINVCVLRQHDDIVDCVMLLGF